jgi:hypothetical protein
MSRHVTLQVRIATWRVAAIFVVCLPTPPRKWIGTGSRTRIHPHLTKKAKDEQVGASLSKADIPYRQRSAGCVASCRGEIDLGSRRCTGIRAWCHTRACISIRRAPNANRRAAGAGVENVIVQLSTSVAIFGLAKEPALLFEPVVKLPYLQESPGASKRRSWAWRFCLEVGHSSIRRLLR